MKRIILLSFILIISIISFAQDSIIPNQTKYKMTEITYTSYKDVYQDGRKLDKAEVKDLFFWTCQPAYDMYCEAQNKLTKGAANCIVGSTMLAGTAVVYASVFGNKNTSSGKLTQIQEAQVIISVAIDIISVTLIAIHIPQRVHGKAEMRQSYDIYNEHATKQKPISYIDFGMNGGAFSVSYHF